MSRWIRERLTMDEWVLLLCYVAVWAVLLWFVWSWM